MADTKISALTALTGPPAADDRWPVVDRSDTTHAASGTTKYIETHELAKFENAYTLAKYVPFLNSGLLFSAETRNAQGVVTTATIAWSRCVEGAANGVFTGTAHGTFTTMVETYTATFPDLSLTITVDFNIDANGQTSNPTVVVA